MYIQCQYYCENPWSTPCAGDLVKRSNLEELPLTSAKVASLAARLCCVVLLLTGRCGRLGKHTGTTGADFHQNLAFVNGLELPA